MTILFLRIQLFAFSLSAILYSCCSKYSIRDNSRALEEIARIETDIAILDSSIQELNFSLDTNIVKAIDLLNLCGEDINRLAQTNKHSDCDSNLSYTVLINKYYYGGNLGRVLNNYNSKTELYRICPTLMKYNFENELWLGDMVRGTPNETIKELKTLELYLLYYLYVSGLKISSDIE